MSRMALELTQEVTGPFSEILTADALSFVAHLERKFGGRRKELLAAREKLQRQLDEDPTFLPGFPEETRDLRASPWKVAPAPKDLQDRRVEITGPVDRKMVINALNSGAKVFMADFEDSHSPTWTGTIEGQINLRDAVRGTIAYTSAEGKAYQLNAQTAVLKVRPRGWHLEEKHVLLDGRPISGGLFDFGLFFFHNAQTLLQKGSGPYFYLPKLENRFEARLWNEVFEEAQAKLGIAKGTIKATVLIETILASFELDEILYELKDHCVGLNCGRWDYIFSFIKKFRMRPEFVLPDRAQVTMTTHFLKSYSHLLIQTCHRRGAHAMGGMAAQIPIKNDPAANAAAMDKVRADKLREVTAGHDGTWVAHPGLVSLAREIFDAHMPGANQLANLREDVHVTPADLVTVPPGQITEDGLRMNVNVSLQYLESWMRGVGCVPIHNLMEDAATAEISRAQMWQWIRHGKITAARFREVLQEELKFLGGKYQKAAELLDTITTSSQFVEFLTLPAYREL